MKTPLGRGSVTYVPWSFCSGLTGDRDVSQVPNAPARMANTTMSATKPFAGVTLGACALSKAVALASGVIVGGGEVASEVVLEIDVGEAGGVEVGGGGWVAPLATSSICPV